MNGYTQDGRPLAVRTPLGADKLLLIGFTASEAISRLFTFRLDTLAENETPIAFEKLLGQPIQIDLELPGGAKRFFHGICSRVAQGERDSVFTEFAIEVVPKLWLLTRKAQSRVFQHVSVPDILRKLFEGLDVSFEIAGTFHARDYCVQYRETDFNFASRLMEEEGIFYFFRHSEGGHRMVVANTPSSHPDVPGAASIIFESVAGGHRDEDRVWSWVKSQELRSGKYTLWDHCFQLPHKHLEATKSIIDSVRAGEVAHNLRVADNSSLELFDYPGEYAGRFDGVSGGGGDQPQELNKIFEDNQRTVAIRMEEEALPSLVIEGASNCRQLTAGHKFSLERHFDANGAYVLTGVQHSASLDGYRSSGATFSYENTFRCIPVALPFRPARVTAKPIVPGTQSAVVVGPPGEEIFPDKFGRVKVQFHWDRAGENDADSSCWVRVATHWAGKQWGIIHIPRIGQEVIVDFIEGDPNEPIIVGSVWNPDMLPPYQLPANKTQSGIKTRSSPDGSPANFNEIRFEDKKGAEQLTIHAEKDEEIVVENNKTESVGSNETITIGNDRTEKVGRDQAITIGRDDSLTVGKNQTVSIAADQTVSIGKDQTISVALNRNDTVGLGRTTTVGLNDNLSVGMSRATTVGMADSVSAGTVITLTAGATITITAAAAIAITAPAITLNGRPVLPIPKPI